MAYPLVLVPGLLCTAALWRPQAEAFAADRDVTIADHTGHASIAGIAAALLEAAPERFALAGLSMGGYIAFEVMRQAPGRVAGLALLDTAAGADSEERRDTRRRFVAVARRSGLEPVIDRLLPQFLSEKHVKDPRLVAIVREMAADTGIEAFARQQQAIMTRPDSRPGLGAIACPTLVLVGAEDTLTPPHLAHEIHAAIPSSHLETVPDCGHLSTIEQPEAVNAAMRVWLESLD